MSMSTKLSHSVPFYEYGPMLPWTAEQLLLRANVRESREADSDACVDVNEDEDEDEDEDEYVNVYGVWLKIDELKELDELSDYDTSDDDECDDEDDCDDSICV